MTFPERVATSEALKGQLLPVEVNTHVAGTLEFESGAIASVITELRRLGKSVCLEIEIHGENGFAERARPQPIRWRAAYHAQGWKAANGTDVPLTHTTNIGRGAGVADMAYAHHSRTVRTAPVAISPCTCWTSCSALEESSEQGRHIEIKQHA